MNCVLQQIRKNLYIYSIFTGALDNIKSNVIYGHASFKTCAKLLNYLRKEAYSSVSSTYSLYQKLTAA